MMTRTLNIDIDIHREIENARVSFEESSTTILRRLLGIDGTSGDTSSAPGQAPWIGTGRSSGITLPHGTRLRLVYNDLNLEGSVDNGALVFDGKRYPTPSSVRPLCKTRSGKPLQSLNGKSVISALLPETGKWTRLLDIHTS